GAALEVGMTVDIWPAAGGVGANAARIRSLESHETRMEKVEPYRRVAASLVGIERQEAPRGSMVGLPGEWQPTRRFLATFRHPRHVDGIGPRNALQLHVGSGAWPIRSRMLSENALLCELNTDLCLQVGDRFILRDTGRRAVVGGGQVLDPGPAARGDAIRRAAETLTKTLTAGPDQIADALLSVRKSASPTTLRAHSGGGRPLHAVPVGELLLHADETRRLTSSLLDLVLSFHEENPMRPGAPAALLSNRIGVSPAVVEALARSEPQLDVEHGVVSHRDRATAADPTSTPQWQRARQLLEADGLAVPRIGELGLDPELFHALVRAGALIKISDELAYLPDQVRNLLSVLASMPPEFTVSDFREAASITRKYAVPFLEWTDLQGKTLRRADTRTVRNTSLY
ncbi:MAG TPA: SelB C-terminal domain-containing protein, partial [Acidimicrobiia bacterium]|nr:SelB C-terminal domain-containing protein [Acidimicrobiia bacterium]